MNWFSKAFTILGPRVLGVLAAGAAAKLAEKGIIADPATLIGIALGTYAIVHKAVSSKVNPGDAAVPSLAKAEQVAVDAGTTVKVNK
jgi:ABC-type antimicrobial peptide transport system permease subunit